MKLKERIVNLIYPPRCPLCDTLMPKGPGLICLNCSQKRQYITSTICLKCGKPILESENNLCNDCTNRKHYFDRGWAVFVYDNQIKKSLYRFKYGNRAEYAQYYANQIYERYNHLMMNLGIDALIPVPIHRAKMSERGYNQAEEIASVLGGKLKIPVYSKLLIRTTNTRPQKLLSVQERENNLKKAFKIGEYDVKLNTIMVVDDIYTTGATMDAMAKVLRAAGIKKIYYIVVAIGEYN